MISSPPETKIDVGPAATAPKRAQSKQSNSAINYAIFFALTTVAFLVATVILAARRPETVARECDVQDNANPSTPNVVSFPTTKPPSGVNPCEGKKPELPNIQCVLDQVKQTGEQSGVNVTEGYQGQRNTSAEPILTDYFAAGLCPVNVHWHLGTEHYSLGEFDETGTGPSDVNRRRRLAGKVRSGYQCTLYDANDARFTTEYNWQHCKDMEVGQTYEVHWPHSEAGACGTINQYQTPFYDGVFCRDNVLVDTSSQIGVQAQVYTVINDESYYYPDLIRGMIVDGVRGENIAVYTGSTTGTSRDNDICSQYAPITWQVDRKCHLVSASSFDKLCADMKAQRDDMTEDLHPHGSRELVAHEHAANNQQNLRN